MQWIFHSEDAFFFNYVSMDEMKFFSFLFFFFYWSYRSKAQENYTICGIGYILAVYSKITFWFIKKDEIWKKYSVKDAIKCGIAPQ